MSIGSDWLKVQKDYELLSKFKPELEARKIIDKIPDIIRRAGNESYVHVFGWVTYQDVAGVRLDKVDDLAADLHEKKRSLCADDLIGRARIVFDWCEANGLECFLKVVQIENNDCEYDFCVRPIVI